MKTRAVGVIAIIAITIFTSLNIDISPLYNKTIGISLANIEALANGETTVGDTCGPFCCGAFCGSYTDNEGRHHMFYYC